MVIEEGNMKKSTKWVVLSLFILCASIVPVNDFDAQENAENSVNLHDNVQTSTSDEYSVSLETTTEESMKMSIMKSPKHQQAAKKQNKC